MPSRREELPSGPARALPRLALAALLAAVTLGGAAGEAVAQRRLMVRPARGSIDHSQRDPYLRYGGVTLRGGQAPRPQQPPAGYQYVNWPGFRYIHGTGAAEVFLQLTGPVTYKVRRWGYRVIVKMKKTQVYLRNNLRPVLTRNFPGAVRRFRLRKRRNGDMWLDIRLRYRRKPTVELKTIGQHTYLVVHFPRGRRRWLRSRRLRRRTRGRAIIKVRPRTR